MPLTVFILGAGATVADVVLRPRTSRPPLDRDFFTGCRSSLTAQANMIARYVDSTYGYDIFARETDSLEAVMSQVYTDVFNPRLRAEALATFSALMKLFTRRLAETTNSMPATNRRWLYRILTRELTRGVDPSDITIITFNQDLQIEKYLDLLSTVGRWGLLANRIFNFPHCYGIPVTDVTQPEGVAANTLFALRPAENNSLGLLKLHGSLNWYSTHTSDHPSPDAMFNPTRRISITRRIAINPSMQRKNPKRRTYALPVVVPPVSHKSAVLHNALREVWRRAEDALRRADHVVIFGYSCPQLDFESSNLLRRSLRSQQAAVTVIDPAASVATRFIELTRPKTLTYHPSAAEFLDGT